LDRNRAWRFVIFRRFIDLSWPKVLAEKKRFKLVYPRHFGYNNDIRPLSLESAFWNFIFLADRWFYL